MPAEDAEAVQRSSVCEDQKASLVEHDADEAQRRAGALPDRPCSLPDMRVGSIVIVLA